MDFSIRLLTAGLVLVSVSASALNFFNAVRANSAKRFLHLYVVLIMAAAAVLYYLLLVGYFYPPSMPLYLARPLAMGFATIALAFAIVDLPHRNHRGDKQ